MQQNEILYIFECRVYEPIYIDMFYILNVVRKVEHNFNKIPLVSAIKTFAN